MTSNTDLEIKGNLRETRLAELLIEILQTKLNGSLRVSDGERKIVVYFDAGDIVFAVSNARAFRLFEILLRENKITKEELAAIPDFTNDLALKEHLLKKNLFPKTEIDVFFSGQIAGIIKDALGWRGGEWIFSPLVRIKGDIRYKIDTISLLLEHARSLPDDEPSNDFDGAEETFSVVEKMPANVDLQPPEAFVLSRFENDLPLSVEKICLTSGLPRAATLRMLYVLWLGGFLTRRDWNSPFSKRQVSHILSANLSLKKAEVSPPKIADNRTEPPPSSAGEIKPPAPTEEAPPRAELTLEEYLERTENAANYYLFFDAAPEASVAEIKTAYFMLARRFHPDLFHTETDAEKHRRIQNAFTRVAQAYETLKNENTRTVYDYKIRKELAEMEKRSANVGAGENSNPSRQSEQARDDFEHGFSLLVAENYDDAIPFLARAAHLDKDNARYRAYYGKALTADPKQKHKAEAELYAAIKLDPDNAGLRLMLAEFFVEVRLPKRAEGELNRLLTIFPDNREARALLDSLAKR